MSHVPQRHRERIQEAKNDQLTALDLSNDYHRKYAADTLTEIPPEVFDLKQLESLSLRANDLTELPAKIGNLANLKRLDLRNNRLQILPESFGKLTNLTTLIINDNQLVYLPSCLGNLSNLGELYASDNQLEQIPESIGNLRNLRILKLKNNRIESLPDSVGALSKLAKLNLSNNQIQTLPNSLGNLSNIKHLELSQNRLRIIPRSIIEIEGLEEIYLNGNDLEIIPIEIAQKGLQSIRRYFRQLDQEGEDYLYEAKLLIVGEAGAGKTTLAQKIINPKYELQNEESTEGIDIRQWIFPMENGRQFQVNIWDFGGQEIYHATHQFFLTKRSLYALVADTRKEDTDLYYWLNIADVLSNNSPLLIVNNEKQDRQREIDERDLREKFTNFKEILVTNLATNKNLVKLLAKIRHYISNLDHVGDVLPKTWKKVRRALEQDSRNYISQDDYFAICQNNGFTKRENKLQLSGYLHDLGIFLHFQDDPLLKKTVILKPEWGTDAVYKVLDNKTVRGNRGKFTKKDLASIWSEEKYVNMHDELLELMKKFKLCYKIPDSEDQYIAPQLLPLTPPLPEYKWDESNNLILRYTYEFMPKGILTRFIVSMHKYIDGQKNVWKSGVVLDKDNTKAEIIEDYSRREIRIRIVGQQKRKLMTEITYELEKTNSFYEGLKYRKLMPCNCSECKNSQDPNFYPLSTLYKFNADKQPIQCQKSYEMINVLSLIDDVILPDIKNTQDEDSSEVNIGEKSTLIINNINNTTSGDSIHQNGNFGVGVSNGEIKTENLAGNIAFSPQTNEIIELIETLRKNINNIPSENQDVVIESIDNLKSEVETPTKTSKLKTALFPLWIIGKDVAVFGSAVLTIAEKLGVKLPG